MQWFDGGRWFDLQLGYLLGTYVFSDRTMWHIISQELIYSIAAMYHTWHFHTYTYLVNELICKKMSCMVHWSDRNLTKVWRGNFYCHCAVVSVQGSGALLIRLYKDAGTPAIECSPTRFWKAVKSLSLTDHSLSESKVLGLFLTCYKYFLDIGTMTIESAPLPFTAKLG